MPVGKTLAAQVRARIAAPPDRLWPLVADPTRHPELAGSGEPRQTSLVDPGRLAVGSRFESRQKWLKLKYTSRSEVLACDQPRLLRWIVDKQTEWEFRFEPVAAGNEEVAGTHVTHSYRWDVKLPGLLQLLLTPLLGMRHRTNTRGMVGTMRNLARLAGAPEPTNLRVSQGPPTPG
jgi:uncharacterized protein YndB with AHSA1/START domain